jgi:nicotinamide-nucleotide amidase
MSDLVVVTGGLGPTRDDLTLATVARHLGRELAEDADLLAGLQKRFVGRGYAELPPSNRAQALVPEGAVPLENPLGTAPGILFDLGSDGLVVLLPGVPREMRTIFTGSVIPVLRDRFSGRLAPVIHRSIHTTGIAESVLADRLEPLLHGLPEAVSIAFLPEVEGVELRLTARGFASSERALEALAEAEALLQPVVAPHRYQALSGDLAEALGDRLSATGTTVAVAESCTGGLVAKRLTDIPGSSRYFLGGVAAYSNEAKRLLAGVDGALIEAEGAVSREVAEALARGVRDRLGADAGIGITGIAGPGGGTADKPVGTVWFAACLGSRTVATKGLFPGDREMIRARAAQAAMALLARLLEEWPDGNTDPPDGRQAP